MTDTIAYRLAAQLKALGHAVSVQPAPKGRPKQLDKDADDLALTGWTGLTPEAVEACADVIRRELRLACEPYALDTSGKCKHYPGASFAAW